MQNFLQGMLIQHTLTVIMNSSAEVSMLRKTLADKQILLDNVNEELVTIRRQLLLSQAPNSDFAPIQVLSPQPDEPSDEEGPTFEIPDDHGKVYGNAIDKITSSKPEVKENMAFLRKLRTGKMEIMDRGSDWSLSTISNLIPDPGKHPYLRELPQDDRQAVTESGLPTIAVSDEAPAAGLGDGEISQFGGVGSINKGKRLQETKAMKPITSKSAHHSVDLAGRDIRRSSTPPPQPRSRMHFSPLMSTAPRRADHENEPRPSKRYKTSNSSSKDTHVPNYNQHQRLNNKSICTACWMIGGSCDSRAKCRRCECAGQQCVRIRCRYEEECRSSRCVLLHPGDWDHEQPAWHVVNGSMGGSSTDRWVRLENDHRARHSGHERGNDLPY
jgi:hypothetical protein